MPQITALYTALCLLLLVALAFNVVRNRLKHGVSLGDAGNKDVTRAMRTHANATEYMPIVLLALAILELLGGSSTALHAYGAVFFIGRVLHAVGMNMKPSANRWRQAGIALSWLVMLGLSVQLVVTAL